jgi:hypothetical protein
MEENARYKYECLKRSNDTQKKNLAKYENHKLTIPTTTTPRTFYTQLNKLLDLNRVPANWKYEEGDDDPAEGDPQK